MRPSPFLGVVALRLGRLLRSLPKLRFTTPRKGAQEGERRVKSEGGGAGGDGRPW